MREANNAEDSSKKMNGFFEFIPEDGSYVDLTQPGLLTHLQIASIFWRRGFASLLSSILENKGSLQKAYFDHVLPLPCRDTLSFQNSSFTNENTGAPDLSNKDGARGIQLIASPNHRLNSRHSDHVKQSQRKDDLDSLVIISNPNWPTSGVTPPDDKKPPEVESKINESGKRAASGAISFRENNSSFQTPTKRTKINRNFANLTQFLCKDKVL